jgi:preprotein translocase subunit YajC
MNIMNRVMYSVTSLFVTSAAFAEDAPVLVGGGNNTSAAQPQAVPGWTNFIFIAAIILFMWLFVFRPQAKRAKEQRNFLAALKPEMEVYTSGGLIGTIVEVKESIVVLNIGTSNIKVLKSSIAGKLEK